jgi:hypothetical protein
LALALAHAQRIEDARAAAGWQGSSFDRDKLFVEHAQAAVDEEELYFISTAAASAAAVLSHNWCSS